MKMDFGVSIGRNDRIDQISDLAISAEKWGFSHLGFVDSQNQSRDIYVMMAVAAQATKRIRLWQTVTVPSTRHPSVTVNATATVNELSGGRAFLGLGAGMNAVETMGMKPSRIKDLRELVEFTKKYIVGDKARWKGTIMQSDWVKDPFKIYLNAGGPKSTELAGELADGVIFMGGPSSVMKWKMKHIEMGATRAGRDLSEIDIVVRSNIYVASSKKDSHGELVSHVSPYAGLPVFNSNDSEIVSIYKEVENEQPGILDEIEKAQKAISEEAKKHGGPPGFDPWHQKPNPPWAHLVTQRMIDSVHLTGNVEEICEGVERYAQLGITSVMPAVYSMIDKESVISQIGKEIIPKFQR